MSLFIDFHAIQAVPPSNINRDEDGSPKSTVFGGTRRARVSSQAWKRAMRHDFDSHLDQTELGVRTLRMIDQIAARITDRDPSIVGEAAEKLAVDVLTASGIKVEKVKPRKSDPDQTEYSKTGALLFLSNPQIDALADLADAPDVNVDAAAQVAHAIGTHTVVPEFDYFTAVDDKQSEDNAGAGMIGTVEFNTATLYRYATVNVSLLQENLGSADASARGVEAFARAFIRSMPTGKRNTFANKTLPSFVLATVRTDEPINFAAAFEEAVEPVQAQHRPARAAGTDPVKLEGSLTQRSITALVDEAQRVYESFDAAPESAYVLSTKYVDGLDDFAQAVSISELVSALGDKVRDQLDSRQ
ncbi:MULTISPECIES: type I-E CRISPR-associated protein Cas7/Cse4/CasC [Gordonia]|uniref:Putative CRISPR-associated protein n=1 Tax=Gordonia sihwensis NBRC 108236 TaxID=1223544 RepID=L7LP24_9ACTN|nr:MULTISPECIES: type I-E CRISPR-associated protein Cas7/Cse4/CasC [Gordonia]AUH69602.1 type I-E CRISPR-associated protein Cas7/Cse4/CasC [Gordonia sp. YC-JH1]GAC61793.1 putative CRISPR-associated protein [Gordonia sihwensis NBRC 108236]